MLPIFSRLAVLLSLLLAPFPALAIAWTTVVYTTSVVVGIAVALAVWVVKRNPKADNIHLKILLFCLVFWPIVFFQALIISVLYSVNMR